MEIRKLCVEDIPQIMEISKEQFKDESWKSEQFKECFTSNYIFNGIFDKGKLVSYALATTSVEDINLLSIATEENYKHKGYAKLLLNLLIHRAKNDMKSISLEVKSTNTVAIDFYENAGFIQEYVRKKYYKDGSDAYLYWIR